MENDIRSAMHLYRTRIRHVRPLAAAALLCAFGATTARAQVTENVVYNFTGGSDGATPGYLRADTSGPGGTVRALYGVAMDGGGQNANCPGMGDIPPGCGTIFKLAPPEQGQDAWNETTLWNFTSGKDGQNPDSALVANSNRIGHATDLYGLTYGSFDYSGQGDSGSVFRLTGNRLKTILKIRGFKDGSAAVTGPMAIDSTGAIYATAGDTSGKCFGKVFKLTPPTGTQTKWTKTTIWCFAYKQGAGREIGNDPAGVTMDATGALYGVLRYRKAKNLPCYEQGLCGGVFKLTPPAPGQTAWTEQTLWEFGRGADGWDPVHAPMVAEDGTLYGTTVEAYEDCGRVYKISPPRQNGTKWKEEIIWRFSGSDACGPIDPPIMDKTGVLYGTTSNFGAVYKLAPPVKGQIIWTETNLFTFPVNGLFEQPVGSLVPDGTGTLYGAVYGGGTYERGFVFSLAGTGFVPQ
jgi:hypothetical protein